MLHHILVCYNMLWDVCHVAVYMLSCAVLQSGMLPYALMQCRDAELSDQQPMLVFLQHKSSADIECAAQSIELWDERKLWSIVHLLLLTRNRYQCSGTGLTPSAS